jgi:hypothetical protein
MELKFFDKNDMEKTAIVILANCPTAVGQFATCCALKYYMQI